MLVEALERTRKLRPATRKKYEKHLHEFLDFAATHPRGVSAIALEDWLRKQLLRGKDPRHLNNKLNAIRRISGRAAGLFETRDFAAAVEPFGFDESDRAPVRRALSLDEIQRLLATCPIDSDSLFDIRDRAILLCALKGGERRGEIVANSWADLDGNKLVVNGKGGHRAPVWLDGQTVSAIERWRSVAPPSPDGAMFTTLRMSTFLPVCEQAQKRLSESTVYRLVCVRARRAGVDDVAVHSLRHTCATMLADAGVSAIEIALHLRHRSLSSTRSYLHGLGERTGRSPAEDLRF